MSEKSIKVGVIGAGSFGKAIASLLARNADVLLFSRQTQTVKSINQTHQHLGVSFPDNVTATNDRTALVEQCELIFPVVASANFREMIQNFSTYLTPKHLLIHGTKGFDVQSINDPLEAYPQSINTISEVIRQESNVVRIGCLSGPNLAKEIMEGQPTATVIGSDFKEVIDIGKKVLTSSKFYVYGTNDIRGAELAGALKNVVAIASGMLKGMGLGKNIQAVLITRGLEEMITFGKALGASAESFYSVAGVGDLIATTTSQKSRNYQFGYEFGQGASVETILATKTEPVEGLRTVKICKILADRYQLDVPLFDTIYKILIENENKEKAIDELIKRNY